jgi:hypothetical protein
MKHNQNTQRVRPFVFTVWPYAAGVAAVVVTALLANEIHSWVSDIIGQLNGDSSWSWRNALYAAILVALLLALLKAWSKIAAEIWRPRTRGQFGRWLARQQPRSHLVVFLSNVIVGANAKQGGEPLKVNLTGDLDSDLEQLAQSGRPFWPWEQMLRAMRVHVPVLEHVYCLCSQESLPQAMWFSGIVQRYESFRGATLHIVYHGHQSLCIVSAYTPIAEYKSKDPAGFDFEDYDQLAPAIRRLIAELTAQGIPKSSIVVDFTGGQKVTSVVAVTETYDSEIVAQYVQTGGAKDVYCYDVVLEKRRIDVPVK